MNKMDALRGVVLKQFRLGEVLVSEGYITDEQLHMAIEMQKNDSAKRRLGQIIIESKIITEEQMLTALSKRLGISYVNLNSCYIDINAVAKIPKSIALKHTVIAVSADDDSLTVVMNDPLNFYAIEDIKLIVNQPITIKLSKKEDIQKSITNWYSEIDAKHAAKTANETASVTETFAFEDLNETADDTPVVTLVNSILFKAHHAGASDIHIEPFEGKTTVRIRVDGQIVDYLQLSASLHSSIVARIKIISTLDIAEKRLPQDGSFRAKLKNIEINVRVSVLPTVFGEKIVMRFFSQSAKLEHAETYGMTQKNYEKVLKILKSPHGIIYVTGPTGSGKTTTLYMIIESLSDKPVNISTIEDPVERHLDRINQTQTNVQAGLTFASGLRSLLRQDPDIIMVGETRDNETASIAVSAALTGHLVFSTIHTNDAVSTILRLVDMDIEEYKIANSLVGVISQRLAKKICPSCKNSYPAPESEQKMIGTNVEVLYKGEGCVNCNNTGYKGRIAIHEILMMDSAVRNLVAKKTPIDEIEKYLVQNGKLVTLKESLTELIISGISTVEEFSRLLHFSEDIS
ncbi:MAG: type secretion system protein [Bacillales bacterium]|jgi:type IV pilus assembly protein PilB|nr:type secretion system protein [Bacillales bacterium]